MCCGMHRQFVTATVVTVLVTRYTDTRTWILQKGNSKTLQNIYSTMKDTIRIAAMRKFTNQK